jgi:hypothetical protein
MSTAAIVLCTTLVMNVGNGSVVTRECHVEEPRVEAALPVTVPPGGIEQISSEIAEEVPVENTVNPAVTAKPDNAVISKKKPPIATVKRVKPNRTKLAKYTPHRKHYRSRRKIAVITAVTDTQRPPKKPTLWDRFKKITQSGF